MRWARNLHNYFSLAQVCMLISRFLQPLFCCVFVEQRFFFAMFFLLAFDASAFVPSFFVKRMREKKNGERFVYDLCVEFIFHLCVFFPPAVAAYFHRTIITWRSINNIHMCMQRYKNHSDERYCDCYRPAQCSHNPKLLFQNSRSCPLWLHKSFTFFSAIRRFLCVAAAKWKQSNPANPFLGTQQNDHTECLCVLFLRIKTKNSFTFSSIFRWIFWPSREFGWSHRPGFFVGFAFAITIKWKRIEIKRKRKIC